MDPSRFHLIYLPQITLGRSKTKLRLWQNEGHTKNESFKAYGLIMRLVPIILEDLVQSLSLMSSTGPVFPTRIWYLKSYFYVVTSDMTSFFKYQVRVENTGPGFPMNLGTDLKSICTKFQSKIFL